MTLGRAVLAGYNRYFLAPGGSFDGVDGTRPHFRFSAKLVRATTSRGAGGRVNGGSFVPTSVEQCSHTELAKAITGGVIESVGSNAKVGQSQGKLQVRLLALQSIFGPYITTPAISVDAADFQDWSMSPYASLAPNVSLGREGWRLARVYFYARSGDWKVDSVNIDPYRKR